MRILAAALLAAFLSISCLPAAAATSGLVRGNVIVNGAPKSGVQVTIFGEGSTLQTTTDSAGDYVFSAVPFGHYQVSAQAARRFRRMLSRIIRLRRCPAITASMQSCKRSPVS